ncbi:hypothetical protein [uncultured Hydrogenophaga sp.]|uniref:hypothetical protein n=1 Tax=uncultured Hydrogenophaga sp. TaxID=199683 RepID=UPI00265EAA48|nr:hypothetical protein [uncultured Hydrogenophaga sp.]
MNLHRADRHPALNAYLQRLQPRLPAARADRPGGTVVLVFREGLRVTFHPVGRGDLVLEARIMDLSERSPADVGALCKRALELAGQRPWHHVDGMAVSPDGSALQLHLWVPADCSVQGLEQQVDDFLSALTSWRSAMGLESA